MKHHYTQSLLLSLGIMSVSSAYAGSANAIFDCKSASGRTTLAAHVPGDQAEHKVTFTVDGEVVEWYDTITQEPPYKQKKNSNVLVIGSMKAKNYHFVIATADKERNISEVFRFSAMPKSIKVKKTAGGETGQLSAIVEGKDPREEKDGQISPKIVLDCTYTYEI